MHTTDHPVELGILGTTRMTRSGAALDLGTPRQRAIVAAMSLSEGRTVGFDTLVDRIWAEEAPRTARATMQRYVAALRSTVEVDPAEPQVIVTRDAGYALRIDPRTRDDVRFVALVERAGQRLQVVADHLRPALATEHGGAAEQALHDLEEAESLWRGTPYADLDDRCDPAVGERVRLVALRAGADRLRATASLALGRHGTYAGVIEARCAEHPWDEFWWGLHAVALVRSGRQADALARIAELRTRLVDDLGIDPSGQILALQQAILTQDRSLTLAADSTAGVTDASVGSCSSGCLRRGEVRSPGWHAGRRTTPRRPRFPTVR